MISESVLENKNIRYMILLRLHKFIDQFAFSLKFMLRLSLQTPSLLYL